MDQGYENRVVAFVDILGWSEACGKSTDPGNNDLIDKLKDAAACIKNHANNFSRENKNAISQAPGISDDSKSIHASIEFSFFSDNFAVSAPSENGKYIFDIVRWASDFLLNQGFLARGAITLGPLHHFDNIIFGPALVDAVECEKKAKVPRILCMPNVIELLEKMNCKKEITFTDCTGQLVVNIACGSSLLCDKHMGVIRKTIETMIANKEPEKYIDNWRYAEIVLPKMFDEYQSRKNREAQRQIMTRK